MCANATGQSVTYYPLRGGEDIVSPVYTVDPSMASLAENYECDPNGRFRRIDGYDRTDGRYVSESVTRESILTVPGSGDVLGVEYFDGALYAFRNTTLGTAAKMYKGTASGWVEVDLGETLHFDGGVNEISVGDTVTGGTSAATGEVRHVIVKSGAWATSNASGYLVIYNPTGVFINNEPLNVSGTGCAVADGVLTAVTLEPDGKYSFDQYNCIATGAGKKLYGVDGKNKLFQFDGATFIQISTGYATDTPIAVMGHKLHIMVVMSDGVIQHSGLKTPTSFNVDDGASYIGVSDFVHSLRHGPGDTAIYVGESSIGVISGASSADWSVSVLSAVSGGYRHSVQNMGNIPFLLGDAGLTNIEAVQEFGDMEENSISSAVYPFIQSKKQLTQASLVCRTKNLYRLFFSDGSGMSVTRYQGGDGYRYGFTRLLYDHPVSCCCSRDDANGNEVMFFGSDDGFVYRMDYGSSFDGKPFTSKLTLHYNALGAPRNKKRVPKILIECEGEGAGSLDATVKFLHSFGISSDLTTGIEVIGAGGVWGKDQWDNFVWSFSGVNVLPLYVNGSGLSFSLSLRSTSSDPSHTINGLLVHYIMRGMQR